MKNLLSIITNALCRDWLKNLELYHPWKNLLHVLDLCRFSVLMVVAGGLLLYSAQGQDMLLHIAGAPFCPDWVVFLFVLTIWASSAGFFALIILSFDFRRKMAPQDPLEVKNKTESAPHWSLDSFPPRDSLGTFSVRPSGSPVGICSKPDWVSTGIFVVAYFGWHRSPLCLGSLSFYFGSYGFDAMVESTCPTVLSD